MEILIGLITGLLIGLTGTGGGVMLTPLLMLLTPFPTVTIIGTGLLTGAATKLVGAVEHRRLGQVHMKLALWLIGGSVPGVLAGVWVFQYLQRTFPIAELESLLESLLAVTLIVVAVLLPFVGWRRKDKAENETEVRFQGREFSFLAAGATVGFLVTLTSVGSGSLMMAFLLLLVPLPISKLVGTDIVFGLATMVVAGASYVWMQHFDGGLFLKLILGSMPGVIIGSRLTRWLPEVSFRWLFSLLYFSLGTKLLVG